MLDASRMSLRHRLLIAMADGQPHEIRELYVKTSNFIRVEEAARIHDGSKKQFTTIEERLAVAKQRMIVEILADMARGRGCQVTPVPYLVKLGGKGLFRSYQLTKEGVLLAQQRMRDYGLLNDGQKTGAKAAAVDVMAVKKELKQAILELLNGEWQDSTVLADVLTDCIPDDLALVTFERYSKSQHKGAWTTAYQIVIGRRWLVSRALAELTRRGIVERTGKGGAVRLTEKTLRAREPPAPVILPFETSAGPDRPPTNLAGNH